MYRHIKLNHRGVSIVELMIATAIAGILIVVSSTVMLYFYGDALRSHLQGQLAVQSQNILRDAVEELRISSGVRENNTISDPNSPPGGWTTSNDDLILIIATPALDASRDFIINPTTGYPYLNEIVYFADGTDLYKRTLANPSATNNQARTSCPPDSISSSCPGDILLSTSFRDMGFTFYDQDDTETPVFEEARSIALKVDMLKKAFGKDITFENNIRITLRNINY